MESLFSSVPALIVFGAVIIPLAVYLFLVLGEKLCLRIGNGGGTVLRPWLWLLVPIGVIALVLVYPLFRTIILSFYDRAGTGRVGWDNFVWSFSSEMTSVLSNNVIWIIALPIITAVLGLVVAVLFDRIRYEKLAMTLIILPTAISFTAGSVIWRESFAYRQAGQQQLGILNALWTAIPGNQPVAWLQTPGLNTLCLIFVAVWSSLGISALILSAAVKSVPGELVEAARLDGAGEWRIFRYITLPHIASALLVVITTAVIFSLKVFDIVYVMTNGNFNTDTIANRMYHELFGADNLGHASAIAVLLLLAAVPIVAINVRQFRTEREVA